MKNINWLVRVRNKAFWIAIIPAVLLLAQAIVAIFGINIDVGSLGNKLIEVVNAVFVVLAILGVVNDPTTASLSDSANAMQYETPKED